VADDGPIQGLSSLLKRLRKLEALKPITAALKLAGAHVMGFMQKYPAASHRKITFKTAKQRRYFFYALKHGKIEVPYRRGQSPGSRNLKQQWKVIKENPLRVVVENNSPYAHWVHSAKDQSFYHKTTGWPTDEAALKEARPIVEREVQRAIQATLSGEDGGE